MEEHSGDGKAREATPRPEPWEVSIRRLVRDIPKLSCEEDEELARGGQGVVIKVWDPRLRRYLAMKVLREDRMASAAEQRTPQAHARFLEEAQVTAQLDHPGIVPIHELGLQADGRVAFTMKLVNGLHLGEVIDRVGEPHGEWTRTRILGVLLKVCEAMAYAHTKGVIHRDLKPSNVMVGRFGEVYVMDWGLARVLGEDDDRDLRVRPLESTQLVSSPRRDLIEESPDAPIVTMDGDIVGTPAYMSPEQALGRLEDMGPHSDVYAAGAMLYHLLAGHIPYVPRGGHIANYAIWMRVQEGPPRPLSELAPDAPPELVAICEKAMARATEARYRDMNELAAELRAFLEHRVVQAHRTGPTTRLAKWIERNPVVVATVLLALATLIGSAVLFSIRLSKEVVAKEQAMLERSRDALGPSVRDRIVAERELYPIDPDAAPAMAAWLGSVNLLLEESTGLPRDEQTDRDLAQLRELQTRVEQRRRLALALPERTIEAQREAWRAAIEAVAGADVYAGAFGEPLVIEPQLGLVPLGPDPRSGLWEFWVPLTGTRPEADEASHGRLRMREDSAIVLVLLPGSPRFAMGDPAEKTCLVRLHPFFMGKHEVSQGQWSSVMETNPSYFLAGRGHSDDDISYESFDARHPVNSVPRQLALELCSRIGLRLPTEAQWEYACRGGTRTRFWFGDSLEHASLYENWDSPGDPWTFVAPIGSLEPNGFGLHDMHGNVAEHCLDRFLLRHGPDRLESTDGSRTWGEEQYELEHQGGATRWSQRGNSWFHPIEMAWPVYERTAQPASHASEDEGFRVSRPLDPCPLCKE